jgi:23S rRNA (guanosine2251-2'-O)-methyltransferase
MVLILDNIRSASNVGALFRTADGLGIQHLYLCGITAVPPNKEIQKTALGATESVNWSYHQTSEEVIQHLLKSGALVVALEQADNSVHLDNCSLPKTAEIALVVGNEVEGIQQHVVQLCSMVVEIPQKGMKKSLNVSVAAGIAMWELLKKQLP